MISSFLSVFGNFTIEKLLAFYEKLICSFVSRLGRELWFFGSLLSQAPCGWALVRLICMKIVTKILTIQLSHGSKSRCLWINIVNDRAVEFDRFPRNPSLQGLAGVRHVFDSLFVFSIENVLLTLKASCLRFIHRIPLLQQRKNCQKNPE
jgi:hypothetical protein